MKISIADISAPVNGLVPPLKGADVFISTILASALELKIGTVTAAKEAGIKRFVPCESGTIYLPKGYDEAKDRICLSSPSQVPREENVQNTRNFDERRCGVERRCPQPYQAAFRSLHVH